MIPPGFLARSAPCPLPQWRVVGDADNLGTIRAACAAWGTGDISSYHAMYSPSATGWAGLLAPEITDEMKGPGEIVEVLESLLGTFEHSELVPEEFADHGDVVVAQVLMRARPRGTTGEISWRLWILYRFRDGLITRQAWYPDREQALDAAGLTA
jgi:ketosteroid isomerase-like protein